MFCLSFESPYSFQIKFVSLAAIDNDSDGNILIFYIVDMAGGYPAHSSLPSLPLLNFTQDMINSSEVIFVHKGIYYISFWEFKV